MPRAVDQVHPDAHSESMLGKGGRVADSQTPHRLHSGLDLEVDITENRQGPPVKSQILFVGPQNGRIFAGLLQHVVQARNVILGLVVQGDASASASHSQSINAKA